MSVIRSGKKFNTSSKVAGNMIKMLLPLFLIFIDVDKMTFNTTNIDKPCKKDKACKKVFTS